MLNEIGISPAEVDKRLVEYYSGLKNADGSNMKIILQKVLNFVLELR